MAIDFGLKRMSHQWHHEPRMRSFQARCDNRHDVRMFQQTLEGDLMSEPLYRCGVFAPLAREELARKDLAVFDPRDLAYDSEAALFDLFSVRPPRSAHFGDGQGMCRS